MSEPTALIKPMAINAYRPRRDFHQPCTFGDKSASDMWMPAEMECMPYVDARYDLACLQLEAGSQVLPRPFHSSFLGAL